MFYLYLTLILLIVAGILWSILCLHRILQQQRQLNRLWQHIHAVLTSRNEELGHLLGLARRMQLQEVAPQVTALQDMLAQEAALFWQDVRKRATIRQQIEATARQLIQSAQHRADFVESEAFQNIFAQLVETSTQLEKQINRYNRSVRFYNLMLLENPGGLLAKWIGLSPAPVFDMG